MNTPDFFPQETDSDTQPFSPESSSSAVKTSKKEPNMLVCGLHLAFKGLSLFIYLFSSFFTSNGVFVFVSCVTLFAMDFWITKNISGRILVGLRWWNEILEDGTSKWHFQAKPRDQINTFEARVFNWGLYINALIWFLLGIVALFRLNLSGVLIVSVVITLSSANIYGYTKCDKSSVSGAMANAQSFAGNYLITQGLANTIGSLNFNDGDSSNGDSAV